MDPYHVFISHKEEDRPTAVLVRDQLAQFSGDLGFFISGEAIIEGEDWDKRLRDELKRADLLLLLFTEPTRTWDWCLYEAGLFEKLDSEIVEPVVCIYNTDGGAPAPLKRLQGVPATRDEVTKFVNRLIRTTEITKRDRPFNDNVTDTAIAAAAEEICERFSGTIEPYYTCYRVRLHLPAGMGREPTEIPRDSTIEASGSTTRLFGRGERTKTWGELISDHIDNDASWVEELDRAFSEVAQDRVPSPFSSTFRSSDSMLFRPELYRLDNKGSEVVGAVVVFTEEVAPAKVGGPIFGRLRAAERYRDEIFERARPMKPPLGDDRKALKEAFELVRSEARAQHTFSAETITTSFPEESMRKDLAEIGDGWDAGVDQLQRAHDAGDDDAFLAALSKLAGLNDAHRVIAAKRYLEVIA